MKKKSLKEKINKFGKEVADKLLKEKKDEEGFVLIFVDKEGGLIYNIGTDQMKTLMLFRLQNKLFNEFNYIKEIPIENPENRKD